VNYPSNKRKPPPAFVFAPKQLVCTRNEVLQETNQNCGSLLLSSQDDSRGSDSWCVKKLTMFRRQGSRS